MLIRCPECLFERKIDLAKIPPTAQLATCPKCRFKFRFRDHLTDDEGMPVEVAPRLPLLEAARPPVEAPVVAPGTVADVASVAAPVSEPVTEHGVPAEAETGTVTAAQEASEPVAHAEPHDSPEASVQDDVVQAPHRWDEDREDAPEVRHAPQDAPSWNTPAYGGDTESSVSEEAIEPAYGSSESSGDPEPSDSGYAADKPHRHLGTISDMEDGAGKGDIWDAIAAMGDGDHQGIAPMARHMQVEMSIPWENRGELGLFAAWRRTVGLALFSPARFFGGFGGSQGIAGAFLFYLMASLLGTLLEVAGVVLVKTFWGDVMTAQGLVLNGLGDTMQTVPGMFGGAMAEAVVRLLVIALGYHCCAKLLSSRTKPFATTFRVVAYSGAAALAGILPLVGIAGARLWFLALSIVGMCRAHNLGWGKTILAVLPVYMVILALVLYLSGIAV